MKLFAALSLFAAIAQAANCPPKIGKSLVVNGGFEQSTTSLSPWSNDKGALAKTGYNSSQSWECANSAGCELSQPFYSCKGAKYYLTFRYKLVQTGSKTLVMRIVAGDTDVYHYFTDTAGAWEKKEIWFSPQDSYQDAIYIQYYQDQGNFTGTGYIDDVQFYAIKSFGGPNPSGSQYVVNGGFENGKIAPWKTDFQCSKSSVAVVSPGLDGSKHALKYTDGRCHYEDGYFDLVYQDIKGLKMGGTYLLQATIRTKAYPDIFIDDTYIPANYPYGAVPPNPYVINLPFQSGSSKPQFGLGPYTDLILDDVAIYSY